MSKTSSKTTGKFIASAGLLLTACAACCAPLIIPPLVAIITASGVGLALGGQIGLGIAVLGGIGGYLYLRRRAASRRAGGCGCDSVSGCAGTDASHQPQRAEKG